MNKNIFGDIKIHLNHRRYFYYIKLCQFDCMCK